VPLEGATWHGCSRGPLCFRQASGRPSHACTCSRTEFIPSQESKPLEGSPCFTRDRGIKCSTVEAAVFASRARLFRRCSRARAWWAAWSGGCDRLPRPRPVFTVMMARFAVTWPLQSWWGPLASEKKRFPAVNARGTSAPESSPAACKSEEKGKRRFFTLALRHFSPPCFHPRFGFASVRLRH
jgi:hypothetical protein